MTDISEILGAWFDEQLPGTRLAGLERNDFGLSAEVLALTLVRDGERQEVVVRLQPPSPALLEPYDLGRQVEILRALEPTPVRAPRVLLFEETGAVLGRPFYVMECLPGVVHERELPPELVDEPDRVFSRSERIVEQIAAIHLVDLELVGLASGASAQGYLDGELDHWSSQVRQWQRGPLPALERLEVELRKQQPAPCPRTTLVHGDAKPGNFAFVGDDVSAVFDWELAAVGDPLADLGWVEISWPVTTASKPAGHRLDELIAHWEGLTGLKAANREWYRALAAYKMAAILVVGGGLYEAGHTDEPRHVVNTRMIPLLTRTGLGALAMEEAFEDGPISPALRA